MFDELTPYGSWACECASVDCLEGIPMTLGEYEALREFPNRFAVLPSEAHVILEVEHVLQKTERYWWVVEKTGSARDVATELSKEVG
jgi:hypothetical protein